MLRRRHECAAAAAQEDEMSAAAASIPWTHDFESALTRAKEQQRHVLIDFTAAPM